MRVRASRPLAEADSRAFFMGGRHARFFHPRGVAQPGSASALGAESRGFESHRPDHFIFPAHFAPVAVAMCAAATMDHGSGNSTARTGTGLSAHLDDDLLTAISGVAESCDSATGDSDLPDAADVSAAMLSAWQALEVTAGEATCDRAAESSADDVPASLIG